jgi:hypothetical protein
MVLRGSHLAALLVFAACFLLTVLVMIMQPETRNIAMGLIAALSVGGVLVCMHGHG